MISKPLLIKTMKYKVIKITNDLSEYPEYREDTERYPCLIEQIEDEVELFVISETGDTYIAQDFFREECIKEFKTNERRPYKMALDDVLL